MINMVLEDLALLFAACVISISISVAITIQIMFSHLELHMVELLNDD